MITVQRGITIPQNKPKKQNENTEKPKDWGELYKKNVDLEKKTESESAVKLERKLEKMFGSDNVENKDTTNVAKGDGAKEKFSILLIEKETRSANLTKSAILATNPPYDIDIGIDDVDGMNKLASKHFDLILINYKLPHIGGLEFLDKTKDLRHNVPIIMVADKPDESVAVEAFRKGVSDYVVKSDDYFKNLPSIVERAIIKKNWRSLYAANVELETKTADMDTAEGAIEIVKAFQNAFQKDVLEDATIKEDWKSALYAKNIEMETETADATAPETTTAESAIETVKTFQKDLSESTGKIDNPVLVIELHNNDEFNKFSKMVSILKNVRIKNIQVAGDIYQVTIWVIPESFHIIR